jgi:hypothetical protein
MLIASWERTDLPPAQLREFLLQRRARVLDDLVEAGDCTRVPLEGVLMRIDQRLEELALIDRWRVPVSSVDWMLPAQAGVQAESYDTGAFTSAVERGRCKTFA